eukprot:gene14608-biopygen629
MPDPYEGHGEHGRCVGKWLICKIWGYSEKQLKILGAAGRFGLGECFRGNLRFAPGMARGLVKVMIPDKKQITLPRTGTDGREGGAGGARTGAAGRRGAIPPAAGGRRRTPPFPRGAHRPPTVFRRLSSLAPRCPLSVRAYPRPVSRSRMVCSIRDPIGMPAPFPCSGPNRVAGFRHRADQCCGAIWRTWGRGWRTGGQQGCQALWRTESLCGGLWGNLRPGWRTGGRADSGGLLADLWRILADSGGLQAVIWQTGGHRAEFWRTLGNGGGNDDQLSPREGYNSQSAASSRTFPGGRPGRHPGGLLADFWRTLADSRGLLARFWRTLADFAGLLADWRRTGGLLADRPGAGGLRRTGGRPG